MKEQIKKVSIYDKGDGATSDAIVSFGRVNNYGVNRRIKWIVLEKQNGKALLQ